MNVFAWYLFIFLTAHIFGHWLYCFQIDPVKYFPNQRSAVYDIPPEAVFPVGAVTETQRMCGRFSVVTQERRRPAGFQSYPKC